MGSPYKLAPCGTPGAYRRHIRRRPQEQTDPACRAAETARMARRRAPAMSYCTMAYCLAHHRSVYINIQDRAWVHSDGWPCEGLADAPIAAGDLE